jgi:uncharacterized phage infection (PIP) family protein YhgE
MNSDKVESMLTQLITMVGNIQSEQQEMKIKLQNMENKLQDLETKEEERHKEIVDRFKSLENDQDFIWEKTARNEREIANIKRQFS